MNNTTPQPNPEHDGRAITPRISLVAWEERKPGNNVFVAIPNIAGRYLRTHKCVVQVSCPHCQATVGEPCIATGYPQTRETRYTAEAHYCRRKKAGATKQTVNDYHGEKFTALKNYLMQWQAFDRPQQAALFSTSFNQQQRNDWRQYALENNHTVIASTEQALHSKKKTMPTPAFNSEKCSADVFAHGESFGLYDMPKAIANRFCQQQRLQGVKVDWHYLAGRVHIKVIIDTAANVQALATAARRLELACTLANHNKVAADPNEFSLVDCQLAECRGYDFDITRASERHDWYIRVGPSGESYLYDGYAGLAAGTPLVFAIAEALDGAEIF